MKPSHTTVLYFTHSKDCKHSVRYDGVDDDQHVSSVYIKRFALYEDEFVVDMAHKKDTPGTYVYYADADDAAIDQIYLRKSIAARRPKEIHVVGGWWDDDGQIQLGLEFSW